MIRFVVPATPAGELSCEFGVFVEHFVFKDVICPEDISAPLNSNPKGSLRNTPRLRVLVV